MSPRQTLPRAELHLKTIFDWFVHSATTDYRLPTFNNSWYGVDVYCNSLTELELLVVKLPVAAKKRYTIASEASFLVN